MGPPLGAPPAQPPVLGTILGPIPEVAGDAEGVLGEEEAHKLRNPPPDSPPPVLPSGPHLSGGGNTGDGTEPPLHHYES